MSANKIKVLVLGQSGMLGHMIMHVLKGDERLSVFGTQVNDRSKPGYLNALEGKPGLRRIFKSSGGFDYCINCIGVTANKIDVRNRSSVKRANVINAVFPWQLAEIARGYGCRVMHISTDGIFRGTKRCYDERSRPDCTDVYGRTKLAGEAVADNFLTIRCSIIGPSPLEHGGLWEWFAGLPEGSRVRGFVNHIWHGVTTLQFSQLCRAIVIRDCFYDLRWRSPVYHFAPNKPVSKFFLLNVLKRSLKLGVDIEKAVAGRRTVSRILRSRFRGLRKLMPYGLTVRKAINQLVIYERG